MTGVQAAAIDPPRATILIVHYGDVVPTIALANQLADYDYDIIIVANDLTTRPAQLEARVGWRTPSRNLGYGEAFTYAIQGLSTPALVLLNTDIVVSRTSFDRCIDVLLADATIGVLGPVLRFADGSLQSGAAQLTRWRRAPLVLIEPGPFVVDCTWVTGAAMFIRKEVAEQVGMDGSYFLGGEDADFCIRVGLAGWRVVCCGDAEMTHHGSQVITGPRWNYYSARNRVWFVKANFGLGSAALSWLVALVMLPRIAVADLLIRRNFDASRLTLLGLQHAFRSKPTRYEGPLMGEPLAGEVIPW